VAKRKVSKASRVKVAKKSTSKADKSKKSSREPKTMDELLAQYGSGVSGLTRGDTVKGEVIEILPGRVVVDIGGKSEGLVAEKAYKEAELYIKTLKVGDRISASVIVPETPDGYTILSLRKAARDAVWKKLEKSEEESEPITVEGKSVNQSGVLVNVFGLNGFIPRSQLGKAVLKNTRSLVGKHFEAVVIDIDRASRKIVLSEKEVSEKEEIELIRKIIKSVKVGDTYEGEVSSIYDFGCFVKINTKAQKTDTKTQKGHKDTKTEKTKTVEVEGLVHISELSWDKVDNPSDIVSPGDKVKVKVIGKTEGRLALSIKQAQKDPWDNVKDKYKKDKKVEGKVVRVSDFGIFVSLEPGVEGLVHMTKIPPGKNFSKGDNVSVYVEEVEPDERKLALGLVLTKKPIGYK
jgi:ribosomal protein S1